MRGPTTVLLLLLCLPALAGGPVALPPLHHPVNVKPSAAVKVPKGFPLDHRGELDCETCHGIAEIEDLPFDEVDTEADHFLRGGPYARPTTFCYRCHQEKRYKRRNIHDLLDEAGHYRKADCEYCHQKALDPKQRQRRQQWRLRLPLDRLCLGCHLKTPHLNAVEHLRKPGKAMRRRMREAERREGIVLPLDDEGRITCVTCHAPHERGLIPVDRPAGRQVADVGLAEGVTYEDHPWGAVFAADKRERLDELRKERPAVDADALAWRRLRAEVLLRLPARDGSLCLACHAFER